MLETLSFTTPSEAVKISLLNKYALFRVNGPDAEKFLQGQLTSSVSELAIGQSTPALHCNPKGRIISSFIVSRESKESFIFRVRKDLYEQASAALNKYMVFSKAKLALANDLCIIAVFGSHAETEATIHKLTLTTAERIATLSAAIESTRRKSASGAHYIELTIKRSQLEGATLTADLKAALESCSFATDDEHALAYLEQGLADIDAGNTEKYLPQELNLDHLGAVNFKKGCYTGQEVIARLHYRGKLKKHMYLGKTESYVPVTGTKIQQLTDSNSASSKHEVPATFRNVGEIISATSIDQKTSYFLALLDDAALHSTTCVIDSSAQPKIEWLPQPYAIT